MGSLSPIQTVVETKNGELLVTINLNLNIKLDSNGQASVQAEAIPSVNKILRDKLQNQNQKVKFEKPDLEDNSEIIEFGKNV